MVETSTDFCVYYGLAYLKPEARGNAMNKKTMGPLFSKAFLSQNGTCIDVPTVKQLVHHSKSLVGQGGFVSDYVSYKDQKLSVDGRPVFGKLANLGGMAIVCTGPGEDIIKATN
jgi:hypothetical protein